MTTKYKIAQEVKNFSDNFPSVFDGEGKKVLTSNRKMRRTCPLLKRKFKTDLQRKQEQERKHPGLPVNPDDARRKGWRHVKGPLWESNFLYPNHCVRVSSGELQMAIIKGWILIRFFGNRTQSFVMSLKNLRKSGFPLSTFNKILIHENVNKDTGEITFKVIPSSDLNNTMIIGATLSKWLNLKQAYGGGIPEGAKYNQETGYIESLNEDSEWPETSIQAWKKFQGFEVKIDFRDSGARPFQHKRKRPSQKRGLKKKGKTGRKARKHYRNARARANERAYVRAHSPVRP